MSNDPPLLQPFPYGTPTDAELEAERDADHAADVAAWERRSVVSRPTGDAYDTAAVLEPLWAFGA